MLASIAGIGFRDTFTLKGEENIDPQYEPKLETQHLEKIKKATITMPFIKRSTDRAGFAALERKGTAIKSDIVTNILAQRQTTSS